MYDEHAAEFLLSVKIPDLHGQTKIVVRESESVFAAKQAVLSKLSQTLPDDPLNYGLYLRPPISGRPGKFLDDGRLLSQYAMSGISQLEFVFKKRDYSYFPNLTEKAITKANTKSNQKKLVDFITHGSVKKIEKLLASGLDPNFILDDGNTPLGLSCGRNGKADCIAALLAGGAHIDFRGTGGLTPMHRAAIGGNTQAMKNLLSFDSSPNYTDDKGLTPLYHAAIQGDDISVCKELLEHKAIIGQTDQIGWTELHQIAKHGNVHLIDIMLEYGADIDAQNSAGNTPLHVAAQHGQLHAAIHLMKRGADREICNCSNQPPNQVAILCGHRTLAKEILNFSDSKREPLKGQHIHMSNGRKQHSSSISRGTSPPSHSSQTLPSRGRSPMRSASPPPSVGEQPFMSKVSTLPRSYYYAGFNDDENSQDDVIEIEPVHISTGSSSSSGSSQNSPQRHRYSDSRKISTTKTISPSSTTTSSPSHPSHSLPSQYSPSSTSPMPKMISRERMYACTPGKKYTVTRDVVPEQPGDLSLTTGMEVEVLYIGKGNYWEGKAGDEHGWFPQSAITIVSSSPGGVSPKSKSLPDKVSLQPNSSSTATPEQTSVVSSQPKAGETKHVTIYKGSKGYGFAMRGVKAVNVKTFKADRNVPALQYVGEVDVGGAADCAGLERGDFIIEVNGVDTTYATHQDVVSIIMKSKGTLDMKVVVPAKRPTIKSKTNSPKKNSPSSRLPEKVDEQTKAHTQTGTTTTTETSPLKLQDQSVVQGKSLVQQKSKSELEIQSASISTPEQDSSSLPINKTSPKHKSSSVKEKDSTPLNQSPLVLHSIRYENSKSKPEASTNGQNDQEELRLKEKEQFERTMKEEKDKEEELSGFAKQLREATLKHYDRTSSVNDNGAKVSVLAAGSNNNGTKMKKDERRPSKSKKNSIDQKQNKGADHSKERVSQKEEHFNKIKSNNQSEHAEEETTLKKNDREGSSSPSSLAVKKGTGSATSSSYSMPPLNVGRGGVENESSDEDDGWTEVETSGNNVQELTLTAGSNSPSQLEQQQIEHSGSRNPPNQRSLLQHKAQKGRNSPSQQKLQSNDNEGNVSSNQQKQQKGPLQRTNSPSLKKLQMDDNTRTHHHSPKFSMSRKAKQSSTTNVASTKVGQDEEKVPPLSNKTSEEQSTSTSTEVNQNKHQPPATKFKPPPPITTKPSRVKSSSPINQVEKTMVNIEIHNLPDDEEAVDTSSSSPVHSIRSKFESLSTKTKTTSPLKSSKPASLLNNKGISKSSQQPPIKELERKDSGTKTIKAEIKSLATSELPHEAVLVSAEDNNPADDDLPIPPPPMTYSQDEDDLSEHDEEFSSPPPPILTQDSESDTEIMEIQPPPPLFDDVDDADILDDDPPIQDVSVPLNELLEDNSTSAFDSNVENDGKADLLDNIVGQLKTLVVESDDNGSDDDDTPPPPLPSSPPPSDTPSEGIKKTKKNSIDVILKPDDLPSMDYQPEIPPFNDDELPLLDEAALPSPTDLPPPTDFPPPPVDIPFTDEYLPPPDELPSPNDLPPPNDLLPHDELPSPNDLPPPNESHTPYELLTPDDLPPPKLSPSTESLPLPLPLPMDTSTEDLSEFNGLLIPPPPLSDTEPYSPPPPSSMEEEFMEPGNTDDNEIFLPPPMDLEDSDGLPTDVQPPSPELIQHKLSLPPPTFDLDTKPNSNKSQESALNNDPVSRESKETEDGSSAPSFASKPLDSWTLDDVCQWMTSVGLDTHIDTFKENEIVGEHLRDLTREDLKDLGISKVGHIKTFQQKLEPYLS